jgi:hypothetical protein
MKDITQYSTQSVSFPRTERRDSVNFLTSGDAGKIIPVSVIPLNPEDSVIRCPININVEMMETAEILMNDVMVRAYSYFVPFLAFDRFSSMDSVLRSWRKEKEREADAGPVDFFQTAVMPAHGSNAVYKALGIHGRVGDTKNIAYVEAYNEVVNFRRRNASKSLTLRTATDTTLAEAMWSHRLMKDIVPDYDAARIDGEISLNAVGGGNISVSGLFTNTASSHPVGTIKNPDGTTAADNTYQNYEALYGKKGSGDSLEDIFIEMEEGGISVSLSNIELAKKTAAFARMRERFESHDEDYIIDLLMNGIRIPDQTMRDPILLGMREAPIRYVRRWATDAGNLDEGVTTGVANISMNVRLPPVTCGGIIVNTVEIVPDPLFERKRDFFFDTVDTDKFPQALRDYLDPEKVEAVPNEFIDVDHNTPSGLFGYSYLNYNWNREFTRIGGKFYRPAVDAVSDVERRRIWSVEQADPTLTADWYLVPTLHKKVFVDDTVDGFDIAGGHNAAIRGLTQFGRPLSESTVDHYQAVLDDVDQTRVKD